MLECPQNKVPHEVDFILAICRCRKSLLYILNHRRMLDQQFCQSLMDKKEMLICWVCIWCWLEAYEEVREIGPCCFLRVRRHVLSGCLKNGNNCRPFRIRHVDDCIDGFRSMGLSVMDWYKDKGSVGCLSKRPGWPLSYITSTTLMDRCRFPERHKEWLASSDSAF